MPAEKRKISFGRYIFVSCRIKQGNYLLFPKKVMFALSGK